VRERLQHQFEPERQVRRSIERGQEPRVIGRVDDDEDAAEILGGRTYERRPANIDLLDERLEWGRRIRGGFAKRRPSRSSSKCAKSSGCYPQCRLIVRWTQSRWKLPYGA
jgi:hypothetical protein